MIPYTAEDVLTLAKRHHNTKRTYLLVNPIQAKHIPVSPSKALEMMTCLGKQIAEKYSEAKLVIGFAETATAIAAAVSGCLDPECKYIHTTRETYKNISDWIFFSEEHSHAVEQKLYAKNLAQWISETSQIIFVDDEISTGKTLLNIVEQLRERFPDAKSKRMIAASIINRLSPEHEARFRNAGIETEFLVKLKNDDLTNAVAHYHIAPARTIDTEPDTDDDNAIQTHEPMMDPRLGVDMGKYMDSCRIISADILKHIADRLSAVSSVLVLGTEECMYPALVFGQELENHLLAASVRCHATTRSPIGICDDSSYPIRLGYKIHSFYENRRETFIYNLDRYDLVVVMTDTPGDDSQACADISNALRINGCRNIVFVEGGRHV